MDGISAKHPLSFGVISASGMAQAHMDAIVFNRARLAAICDIDYEKARQVGAQYGVEDFYQDYRQLIARPDIDAVVVCTPDQLHPEMTVAALEAGKHVLCEKPMAMTVEECRAMIDASRRTGKKLMVGQVCRYAPGFVKAKELIDSGEIGELFFVESEYAHDYSHISGADNWRKDPVRLRHPVLGGGCHAFDLLRWIAGDPYEVTAYSSKKVLTDWPVDDCTISILKFPNGILGKAFVSIGCKRKYTMRSVFYGSKGTVIVDNTSPELTLYRERLTGDPSIDEMLGQSTGIVLPVSINNHNTVAEIGEFIDSIENDKPVRTDGVQGASTVAACLAAVESARTGRAVSVSYDF